MSELGKVRTHGDSPKTPTLQGEPSKGSPTTSATSRKDHELETDSHHRKSSLLAKVKEKARRLQRNLSLKKKQSEECSTPSSGVRREDYEDKEDDEGPEYVGAPMYVSETAPDELKEVARQHPRADPVIPEKHVLPTTAKHGVEKEKEKPSGPDKTMTVMTSEKPGPADAKEKPSSPKKTITETVNDKLTPAYAEETRSISRVKTVTETVSEMLAPADAAVSEASQAVSSNIKGLTLSAPVAVESYKTALSGTNTPAASETKSPTYSEQVWDKGVSVKEYIMQKLEPGEDERVLSQVITKAISPRKGPSHDAGVVDRMRGAVSSLIWTDKSKSARAAQEAPNSPVKIPVSTNAHELAEEENHGRILQPN